MQKLLSVYELTKHLDCDFSFTKEEMRRYKDSDIYAFMLGRKIAGSFGPKYKPDWRESNTLLRGKQVIHRTLTKVQPIRKDIFRKDWREDFKDDYDTSLDLKFYETNYTNSKALLPFKRVVIKTKIPLSYRGSSFRPKPGFNPLYTARKQPFYYTIGGIDYYFGWSRAFNFLDVTQVLQGRADWPASIEVIIFDSEIDKSILGAYPIIAYCFKRKITKLTQKHYINYISKVFSL